MKKAQPFLLVVTTSVVLLAGLWATGLLNTGPRAEKGAPPPEASKKGSEKATPQELILGKWEGTDAKGLPIGMEFTDKGVVKVLPFALMGTYKFVDDDTLETELAFGKVQTSKSKVVVTKDELTIEKEKYDPLPKQKKGPQKYKRVEEFSLALTKKSVKPSDKEESAPGVPTGQAVLTFKKHEASVESVAISPDGTLVASGADDGVVIVWERATGKIRHKLVEQQSGKEPSRREGVRSVAFSLDGSTVASDGIVLWNVDTGERRRGSFAGRHVAFSPDGKTLAIASFDKIHVWDLTEDKKIFSKDSRGSITGIAISPDGKMIASGDLSNYVRVLDAKTGEQTFSHKDSRAQVYSVAFSPDSNMLAVDSGSMYLTLFDLKSGDKVPLKGQFATTRFSRPVFLPDGKHIACEHRRDDSVRIVDLESGEEKLALKGHTGPIKSIAISSDGKWLASTSQDETVKIWGLSSVSDAPLKLAMPQPEKHVFKKRDAVMPVLEFDVSQVTGRDCIAISPDTKHLVTQISNLDASGELQLWNIEEKKLVLRRNYVVKHHMPKVAFSSDSQLFASCADDGAKVWRIPTVEELILQKPSITPEKVDAKIELHFAQVLFSKDGKKVAACGRYSGPRIPHGGGILAVWETANGTLLTTIADSQAWNGFDSMAFSPAADRIAYSVSSFRSSSIQGILEVRVDREVRVWSLIAARQLNALQTSIRGSELTWNEDGSLLAIAGLLEIRGDTTRSAKTLFWDTTSERGTYLTARGRLLASGKFMLSHDKNGAHVLDAEGGGRLFTIVEGWVQPLDGSNQLAVIKGSKIAIWRIDSEALELVRQERLSKVAKSTVSEFTIRGGYEVPQDGFWIDAAISPIPTTNEHRLVIAVHKGDGFKHAIKVKASSNDKMLSFAPEFHEIKADDMTTQEVVIVVRDLNDKQRYTDVTIRTDPPSNEVETLLPLRAVGIKDIDKKDKKLEDKKPLDYKKDSDKTKEDGLISMPHNGWSAKVFLPGVHSESAFFNLDGKMVICVGGDGTVRVWSIAGDTKGQTISKKKMPPDESFGRYSVSVNRQKIVWTKMFGSVLSVWDVPTGKNELAIKCDSMWGHDMSLDCTLIAAGCHDNSVRLWSAHDGKVKWQHTEHSKAVPHVRFSPDAKYLASASQDKTVVLWDVESGKKLHVLQGHKRNVKSIVFSPNSKRVVSVGFDNTAILWDVDNGNEQYRLKGDEAPIFAVAFSPNGSVLASASGRLKESGEIKIMECVSGKEVIRLKGHRDVVLGVAFSPDGKLFASASRDKTIKIWRVSNWSEEITLAGHEDAVDNAAFSPDGKRVLTTSWDGMVRVWDVQAEMNAKKE